MRLLSIEVNKFKSFGSYVRIPLREGFTVVSGPNGSGKSNIIDSLLFALGLSDSRGLRAGKLSDLIHQGISRGEAVVTVSLGDDDQVLTVKRKLRVNGANYTSTYHLNDRVCTLGELHEELAQHRIYPQGYNVVLQGDVTDIIAMSAKARREIIDELAGVADFDRKINLARRELDETQDQEERLHFVVGELEQARERLNSERKKAEEYQTLRQQLEQGQIYLQLLILRDLVTRLATGEQHLATMTATMRDNQILITAHADKLAQAELTLTSHRQAVKKLGEEEQITLQTQLTAIRLTYEQTQQQQQENRQQQAQNSQLAEHLHQEAEKLQHQQQQLKQDYTQLTSVLSQTRQQLRTKQQELDQQKEHLNTLSKSSEAWVRQQTQFTQKLQQLQQTLSPLQQTLTRLAERLSQQAQQLGEANQELEVLSDSQQQQQQIFGQQKIQLQRQSQLWETLKEQVKEQQKLYLTDISTLRRLEKEAQQLGRELDQIEAHQQATRELEGHAAIQVVMRSSIQGLHGPVLHLAQVETAYQLALEIAAGGRLFNIVVNDDDVAAQAIALLKQQRAGRATFLPLTKLRDAVTLPPLREREAVGYAVDLLDFEPAYRRVFAYVFGDTVVYRDLESARHYLGKYRIVTLGGELLEKSGAMTGGSLNRSRTATVWKSSSVEIPLEQRQRLQDLETMIQKLTIKTEQQEAQLQKVQKLAQEAERKNIYSTGQYQQLEAELTRLTKRLEQLQKQKSYLEEQQQQDQQAQHNAQKQLAPLEQELLLTQQQLTGLKTYGVYQEWQNLQRVVNELDTQRQQQQALVFQQESQLQKLEANAQLFRERTTDLERQSQLCIAQKQQLQETWERLEDLFHEQKWQLEQTQQTWTELETTLHTAKTERDHWEITVEQLRRQLQECQWQQQLYQEKHHSHTLQLVELQERHQHQHIACQEFQHLTIPEDLTLEHLQQQHQKIQRRLGALEPVNMLAIEEYQQTQTRLDEMSTKLTTLAHERTEILLRVANLDTLKQEAFLTAFDAVNEHFQRIFAVLSDGDGHLALENVEHPFTAGLTLVAHPKGKKIRRLESMSGGEKSLTALSFIFALQQYRPSPFYAFDEVDMFLDGANVERLAHMIQQSAQSAQFLVVSLRRPMIERADQTIGVTLGRDQQSQVLGLKQASLIKKQVIASG